MLAFLKLYIINFFKTGMGPFFSFVFPVMMLFILGSIMPFSYLAPGLFVLPAVTIGTITTSMIFADFNSSKIFTRLSFTSLSKTKVFLTTILFNVMLALAATLVTFGAIILMNNIGLGKMDLKVGETIFKGQFKLDLSNMGPVQWIYTFGAPLLLAIMLCPIGILIGLLSKDGMSGAIKGLFVYFPVTFLSGVFLDLGNIANAKGLDKISAWLPSRWVVEVLIKFWSGENNIGKEITGLDGNVIFQATPEWYLWGGPIAALVIGFAFTLIAIKRFKWE